LPTPENPILLFFATSRSGPARRMESLLAHLARKERDRLRVWRVDADQQRDWVERFKVSQVPTLVLVKDRKAVARLEGRASAPQIERMLEPFLPAPAPDTAVA
jgi:thioredoxin 1